MTLNFRVLLAVGSVLGVSASGYAQTPSQNLDTAAIDQVFESFDTETSPGCAVGVYADQRLAYANGYGMANLDWQLPITPETNFYLGSVGKQFTAAVILHAVRAGHLSLEDPVQTWIPELPVYERTITVSDLVHHTSGLRDYIELIYLGGGEIEELWSEDQVLDLIARQKGVNFPTGAQYTYSNTGYFLLSVVVERATGSSLREYAQTQFFEPLGMHDTRFHDDRHDLMPRRATGYETDTRISNTETFELVGSGGVYSSVEDLLAWDSNFYTEQVGGTGFTDQLLERGVLNDGTETNYGFGLMFRSYRGLDTVYHGGSLLGFRAMLLRFPEQQTSIAVLCNTVTRVSSLAYQVADIVLDEHLEPLPETEPVPMASSEDDDTPSETLTLPVSTLEAYTGSWMNADEVVFNLQIVDEALQLDYYGDPLPLQARSETRFWVEAFGVEFEFSQPDDTGYQVMELTRSGNTLFATERVDPQVVPESAAGLYYSDELGAVYSVEYAQDQLLVGPVGGETMPAYPIGGADRYSLISSSIQMRTEAGQIVGFNLDAGRVQGIEFVKQ